MPNETQNKFLSFFLKEVEVTKSLSLQLWMIIAAIVAIILFAVIIVSVIVSVKRQAKAAKASLYEPHSSDGNQYMPVTDEESDIDTTTQNKFNSLKENKAVLSDDTIVFKPESKKPVAEVKPIVPEEKPVAKPESKKAVLPEEKPVAQPAEEKATQPPVATIVEVENKKSEKTQVKPVAPIEAKPKEEEVLASVAVNVATTKPVAEQTVALEVPSNEESTETDPASSGRTVAGKFELCNSVGGFRYLLLANNGQLLYESRDYKAKVTCKEAIDKFITAVNAANFKIRADKFGNFKFLLKSPTSANVVYDGESYSTKKACLSAVESLKRFAPISNVLDITATDFAVNAKRFEIPSEIAQSVTDGQGAEGRWEIAKVDEEDPKSPYVYLLYANNGQLLYESREYRALDSCKNGIDTFIRTLKEGDFIIDKDKFGRFKFILRSKNSSSQVEYYGQNYDNRGGCESSAVSVYKFGLLTPVRL